LSLPPPKEGTTENPRFQTQGIESAGRSILLADFDGDGCVDMVMGGIWDPARGGKGPIGRLVCGMYTGGRIEWGRTWVPIPAGGGDVAADFDNDGRTDILCRGQASRLMHNEGDRRFKDVTQGSGLETLPSGGPVVVADFDRDGRLDIFAVGAPQGGKPGACKLFHNQGSNHFADVTAESGLPAGDGAAARFGTGVAVDFDNDGWMDLLVCQGDSLRLYRNLGNGRFQDVTAGAGLPAKVTAESSVAAGDYDMDGRVDVLCVTADRGAGLLHNTTTNDNAWINVVLSGPPGNPEGAGARVTVYAPGKLGDDKAILGYQEWIVATDFKTARPLHFGLGGQKTCDVRVVFPGGATVDSKAVATGKTLRVAIPAPATMTAP
jgi:hypothetical protein